MNRELSTRTIGAVVGAVLLLAFVTGCGGNEKTAEDASPDGTDSVTVTDVWARPGAAGGPTAVYMTVTGGGADDELVAVSTEPDFADTVDMHETVAVDENGDNGSDDDAGDDADDHEGHDMDDTPLMTMQPVAAVAIPADDVVEFIPGGHHIMVMGLGSELSVGDRFPVTFTFTNAGDITVTATVRE